MIYYNEIRMSQLWEEHTELKEALIGAREVADNLYIGCRKLKDKLAQVKDFQEAIDQANFRTEKAERELALAKGMNDIIRARKQNLLLNAENDRNVIQEQRRELQKSREELEDTKIALCRTELRLAKMYAKYGIDL